MYDVQCTSYTVRVCVYVYSCGKYNKGVQHEFTFQYILLNVLLNDLIQISVHKIYNI